MSHKRFSYLPGLSKANAGGVDAGIACDQCHAGMVVRHATAEKPYPYALSGLKNVVLVGIPIRYCSPCHVEVPTIPRIGELHKVIADSLIRQPAPLTGDQIRFLRKNAGFAAQKFAALIGVDPAHLSRVETGKTRKLGLSSERLARAVVTVASRGGDAVRKVLLEVAERNQNQRKEKKQKARLKQPLLFSLRGNRWAA